MSETSEKLHSTKPKIYIWMIPPFVLFILALVLEFFGKSDMAPWILFLAGCWVIITLIGKASKLQKPQTCIFISISVSLIAFVIIYFIMFAYQSRSYVGFRAYLLDVFEPPAIFLLPLAFVSGVYALIKIRIGKGFLKRLILSILAVLMPILSFQLFCQSLVVIRGEAHLQICQSNIMNIAKAIELYKNDYTNQYPVTDKWCDLLIEHSEIIKREFICKSASENRQEIQSHYAINPNAQPNSPAEMVLLFETKGGWNRYGGPELLTTENHDSEGCNVVFNDFHVEFVKPEAIEKLMWTVEEK